MQQGQDPDTDNAVVHTQSTINTESSGSDSEYDADVVAELRSDKGERRVLPKIPVSVHNEKKDKSHQSNRLGPLQLPAYHIADDLKWTAYMPKEDVNSYFGNHRWHLTTATPGLECYEKCDEREPHSAWWYFAHVFPMRHINIIEELTNRQLLQYKHERTNKQEIIRFLGLLLLIPRMPDMPRCDMWRVEPRTPFGVAADLGRTGFAKNRFEQLFKCIR